MYVKVVWAVFSKNTVKFEAINPESMQQKTAATLQPGIGGQKQAHRLILDTRVVLVTRVVLYTRVCNVYQGGIPSITTV